MKLLKTKQDREQCNLWLDFLEAGVFEQGMGLLEPHYNSYCCLGVGCVITIPEENLIVQATESKKLVGAFPSEQEFAPKWLKDINKYSMSSFGFDISDSNDEGMTHLKIAKTLRKLLKDQL